MLDVSTGSTLDHSVQASSSASPTPPAPVGQRSQTAATARATSTNADTQKPPDLLEQRRGKIHFILRFHNVLKMCLCSGINVCLYHEPVIAIIDSVQNSNSRVRMSTFGGKCFETLPNKLL